MANHLGILTHEYTYVHSPAFKVAECCEVRTVAVLPGTHRRHLLKCFPECSSPTFEPRRRGCRMRVDSLRQAIMLIFHVGDNVYSTVFRRLNTQEHALTIQDTVVTVLTTSLTFNTSTRTFCRHNVLMCFVWISGKNNVYFPIQH